MTHTELMADVLTRNANILKMTVADFSDEDLLTRPVPGANHATWQLGHLVASASHLVGAVAPDVVPAPLASFGEKFSGKTANVDDPAFFPKKAQLLEAFAQAYDAAAHWVSKLTPEDLNRPTPGRVAEFAPTAGHIALMLASHVMMHVGQMQVIRRRLGKPLLF
jgi:DinB superfamily